MRILRWMFRVTKLDKIINERIRWTTKVGENACSGQRQFSTVSFSGFGLWVRVMVLGSVYDNRFPNSNPNLNHNSNRNLTITPILTPNSS